MNTPFKMRQNGGEAARASETSPNSYSMNQERTMANMGMVDSGMNYGTPLDMHDGKHTGTTKGSFKKAKEKAAMNDPSRPATGPRPSPNPEASDKASEKKKTSKAQQHYDRYFAIGDNQFHGKS